MYVDIYERKNRLTLVDGSPVDLQESDRSHAMFHLEVPPLDMPPLGMSLTGISSVTIIPTSTSLFPAVRAGR